MMKIKVYQNEKNLGFIEIKIPILNPNKIN